MTRRVRTIGRLLPLAVIATMLAGSQTAQAGKGVYRADAQIKGGPADVSYLGDNVYNTTASGQTKTRQVRPGHTDGFHILVQNDGSRGTDSFFLDGAGSTSLFTVKYFFDGTNITSAVEAGTYSTSPLALADSEGIIMTISAKGSAPYGSTKTFPIVASSEAGGIPDTVAAKIIVKKSGGDQGGQRAT
jgi:hypothetical protein